MKGLVEVIPGRLLWAPEAQSNVLEGLCALPAIELIAKANAVYAVPHYSKQSLGKAFGPIAMDRALEFCSLLFEALCDAADSINLDTNTCPCLALATPENDVETRTNVAAMLGVYLVLRHGWSAAKVRDTLGRAEADLPFKCSWTTQRDAERHHTVYSCWAGIELARELEWIHPAVISESACRAHWCRHHQQWSHVYDGAWIVPGHVMVCADPSTTVVDPNPSTFKNLYPPGFNSRASSRSTSASSSSTLGPRPVSWERKITQMTVGSMTPQGFGNFVKGLGLPVNDDESINTVCKEYDAEAESEAGFESGSPPDFVTRLKDSGVQAMIRCNYDDEPGMPKETYVPDCMKAAGIAHVDVIVADVHGGLPTRQGFRGALAFLKNESAFFEIKPGAAVVHCKGGFGRSVVLACLLTIEYYDVSGDALMGWVRMVRPGALTTPIQEKFLKQMTGRAAVRRWARLSQEEEPGANLSSLPGLLRGASFLST